jgi:hypothetical protein
MERGCITAAMEAMNTTRVVTEKPVVIGWVEGTSAGRRELYNITLAQPCRQVLENLLEAS